LAEVFARCTKRRLADVSPHDILGCRARAFLESQGFAAVWLPSLPLGLVGGLAEVRQELVDAGFTTEEVRAARLLSDRRLAGSLAGPIRDWRGRIVSFWARSPDAHRWPMLFRDAWWEGALLYGLDVALPAVLGASAELVLVVRVFDTMLCHAYGLANVAAIGSLRRQLDRHTWARLAALGVRRVALVLEEDHAYDDQLLAAIDSARQAEPSLLVRVVSLKHLAGIGSLRELLHRHGPEGLRALLNRVEPRPDHPPPESNPPLRHRAPGDSCPLHGCAPTECFCFD